MSQTSNYQIKPIFQGNVDWAQVIPNVVSGVDCVITRQLIALGDNLITSPSNDSKFCIIVPPQNNTLQYLVKKTTTDVGITYHRTNPAIITFDTTVPNHNFYIVVGGTSDPSFMIIWG